MGAKQKIFEETLKTPYCLKNFVNFSRELFTGLKIFSTSPKKPTQNFSEHIKEFYPLGRQNNIAVLAVNLQKNEPCTTAYQQLFPLFENDSDSITLDDLENAFSVERVTKEFFDKYAEKFYQVRDFLENNSDFKIESQAHGFSSEQFAKKLLGQIVFLYFLQKKGWLGVEKNSDWGTGSPTFMRKIFGENESTGKNFFDEVLEPLFYTALNVDRTRQNDLYPKLNLRIPFLNGGLFEELDNYDWQKNNFSIPNEIFSNVKEKERDADISNFAENKSLQISEEIFSPAKKINRLAELDKFLQDVKVADLAVGSGAFPLGMLNEITKAREVLFSYLNLGNSEKFSRSLYDLKIETIKNSIFACDIEPSAVDIAKLRLWLSIVIEDEPPKDKKIFKPKPLPNLDCNIICGNTLIDEFEGVQLIKHSKFLNNFEDGDFQTSLLQNEVDIRIADLIRVQKNLFHETNHARKEEFRKYIRDIYDSIVIEQLGKNSALAKKI